MNLFKTLIPTALALILILSFTGCFSQNTKPESLLHDIPSSVVVSESSVSETPVPSSENSENTENSRYDDSKIVASVQDIIQQYKDGLVDTESGTEGASASDFGEQPSDFEFPEVNSIDDFLSVEPIDGWEDTLIVQLIGTGENPVMMMWIETAEDYKVSSVNFVLSSV